MTIGYGCSKGCITSRALLSFDLSTIVPPLASLLSVDLHFYVEQQTGANFGIDIYRNTRSTWAESGAVWNHYDCPNNLAWSTAGGDYSVDPDANWTTSGVGFFQVNILDLATDAHENRNGKLDLLLKASVESGADHSIVLRSREYGTVAYRPYITVAWTLPTPTPSPAAEISNDRWEPAGPGSFFRADDFPSRETGVAESLVVLPQAEGPPTVFLGTPTGGVWKSTDGGQIWETTTDDLKTLRMDDVVGDLAYPDTLFISTGNRFFVPESASGGAAGIYRSVNAGETWCQIGPPYPVGTSNNESTLVVGPVAIDDSKVTVGTFPRVWAPTSRGLYWSDNAMDETVACAEVTWTQVEGLKDGSGNPFHVFEVHVSPWNASGFNRVFAAVRESFDGSYAEADSGWWRSNDAYTGGTWTQINTGLPTGCFGRPAGCIGQVQRSSIARNTPNELTAGRDILYSILPRAIVCSGQVVEKTVVHRYTSEFNSWTYVSTTGDCDITPRSVTVSPTDSNVVAFGKAHLYRTLNGGNTWQDVTGLMHVDHSVVHFDPTDSKIVWVGNDGGVFRTNNFEVTPVTWESLPLRLPITLFTAGAIDPRNYGINYGPTHDNGHIKGAQQAIWSGQLGGGDVGSVRVDGSDSNVVHGDDGPIWTMRNGGWHPHRVGGAGLTYVELESKSLASDPEDSSALAVWDHGSGRVMRTTDQGAFWSQISNSAQLPYVNSVEILPSAAQSPSDRLIIGTCDNDQPFYRTTSPPSWSSFVAPGFGCVADIEVSESDICRSNVNQCLVYAGRQGGTVLRSENGGQTWDIISSGTPLECQQTPTACLPEGIAIRSVAIDPEDEDVLFVAADTGLFRGELTVEGWRWNLFTEGMPDTVDARDLALHTDSGILRVFTYGRGAWERRISAEVPVPDRKLNDVSADTRDPQVSSAGTGELLSLVWIDDRTGINDWHVYFRGFEYDANGQLTPHDPSFRVDSTSSVHIAEGAVVDDAGFSIAPSEAVVAWHDNREGENHVYFNYVTSYGLRWYVQDRRVDAHPDDRAATWPGVAMDNNGEYAVVWQAEKVPGTGPDAPQDVFIQLYDLFGVPKGSTKQVNPIGTDGRRPVITSHFWNSYFVAWVEYIDADNHAIMLRNYDLFGAPVLGPTRIDDQAPDRRRGRPALGRGGLRASSGPFGRVAVAWEEELATNPPEPEWVVAVKCLASPNACEFLDSDCRRCVGGNASGSICLPGQCGSGACVAKVACPPSYPFGAQRAWRPSTALDSEGNLGLVWQGNVNDPGNVEDLEHPFPSWNPFARTFDVNEAVLENDFRVDFADRADAIEPVVARGPEPGRFTYVWRDVRNGQYEIYGRTVPE